MLTQPPLVELTENTTWTLGKELPADLGGAWRWCTANVDGRGHKLTINHGTLIGNWELAGRVIRCPEVIFDGQTPYLTTLSSTVVDAPVIYGLDDVAVTFRNSTIRAVAGFGIALDDGCIKVEDIWWGRCGLGCLDADVGRSKIRAEGRQTLLFEDQKAFAISEVSSGIELACEIVISGAPKFSEAFVHADMFGTVDCTEMTVSNYGAAQGRRWTVSGGIVQLPKNGQLLPGNSD